MTMRCWKRRRAAGLGHLGHRNQLGGRDRRRQRGQAEIFGYIGAFGKSASSGCWRGLPCASSAFVRSTSPIGSYGRTGDPTTASAVGKLLRASVIITGVLMVHADARVQHLRGPGFGGVGGIAVGFAARDLLANFFGAIMVFSIGRFRWVTGSARRISRSKERWRKSAGA